MVVYIYILIVLTGMDWFNNRSDTGMNHYLKPWIKLLTLIWSCSYYLVILSLYHLCICFANRIIHNWTFQQGQDVLNGKRAKMHIFIGKFRAFFSSGLWWIFHWIWINIYWLLLRRCHWFFFWVVVTGILMCYLSWHDYVTNIVVLPCVTLRAVGQ